MHQQRAGCANAGTPVPCPRCVGNGPTCEDEIPTISRSAPTPGGPEARRYDCTIQNRSRSGGLQARQGSGREAAESADRPAERRSRSSRCASIISARASVDRVEAADVVLVVMPDAAAARRRSSARLSGATMAWKACTTLPDFCRTLPRSAPSATRSPVSSSVSRRAVSRSDSPASTRPLGMPNSGRLKRRAARVDEQHLEPRGAVARHHAAGGDGGLTPRRRCAARTRRRSGRSL